MKKILWIFVVSIAFTSCGSYKNLTYLQDVPLEVQMQIEDSPEITIKPKDIVSIVVSSNTPELAIPFNLPLYTYQAGADAVASGGQRLLGYTVSPEGDIDFPVLGKLHIIDLTREGISEMIKEKLISENYISDPVVTVQLMQFKVHVIGEVVKPGTYDMNGGNLTILEALSMAGDLSVYGKRENVKVIREKNGERTVYEVDLRSSDIFNSPVYYIQQNDIVYVEPNKYKARQSTNSNQFTQVSLWVSIASLFTTVTVLILNQKK